MYNFANRFQRLLPISTIIILIALLSFSADAKGGWWDKGSKVFELFKQENAVKEELTLGEIGGAFKDALQVGTENVVSQLGSLEGFNADPAIHIPLPKELDTVKNMLDKVGMSSLFDDLETKLNRAAETATPKAKALFGQAITEMTFDDVKALYNGPEDAATKYFQGKMTPSLSKEMVPIVETSLSQVGAVQSYDKIMGRYKSLPFVPDVKADLTDHVVNKGMDGIFYYLAKEEAAIRQNPVKQTTALLKRVFGK